jgi:hypothetical protein
VKNTAIDCAIAALHGDPEGWDWSRLVDEDNNEWMVLQHRTGEITIYCDVEDLEPRYLTPGDLQFLGFFERRKMRQALRTYSYLIMSAACSRILESAAAREMAGVTAMTVRRAA